MTTTTAIVLASAAAPAAPATIAVETSTESDTFRSSPNREYFAAYHAIYRLPIPVTECVRLADLVSAAIQAGFDSGQAMAQSGGYRRHP
jgi:hypothetical protein